MNQDMTEKITKNKMVLAVAAFALVTLAMIVIGIMALKVPAVAMCVLIILEAGLAVMLHHAELWLHGVLVLAEVIVGIAIGKAVLIILCAVVYVAATVFLQMLDKREEADGR
jgi:hypothetical protein